MSESKSKRGSGRDEIAKNLLVALLRSIHPSTEEGEQTLRMWAELPTNFDGLEMHGVEVDPANPRAINFTTSRAAAAALVLEWFDQDYINVEAL